MLFKDISYLELWLPFCLAEQNRLCSFRRGHHEEYLEFGPVVQVILFKDISYQWSGIICAISVEGIMRNIFVVKLF